MSQENVEIVRSLFAEFETTQRAVGRLLAPDFVFDMSTFRGWPDEPRYTGPEGFDAFFAKWLEPYEEWGMDLIELRETGEGRVVVTLTQRGRLRGSRSWIELRFGIVCTVADGLLRRMESYMSPAEALEAVGLLE